MTAAMLAKRSAMVLIFSLVVALNDGGASWACVSRGHGVAWWVDAYAEPCLITVAARHQGAQSRERGPSPPAGL